MHPKVVEAIVSPRASATWRGCWRLARQDKRRLIVHHQVDDPQSHQLLCLVPRLREAHDVEVEVRVVPPPTADQDPEPALARAFALRDAQEWARFFDVEPVAGAPDAASARGAQAVLLNGQRPGNLDEAIEISRALWAGEAFPPAPDVALRLSRNQAALHRRGFYRGGSIFFEGEHYLGLSRLGRLEARLREDGAGPSVRESAALAPRRTPHADRLPPGCVVEVFYSFRSPYSYIAAPAIRRLTERYAVEVQVRPVLPMVMRGLAVPLRKRLFLVRDAKEEAEARGQPFGRLADPIGVGVERLLAVWPLAAARGRGVEYLEAVGRAVWAEGVDVATDEGLYEAAGRVDIAPREIRVALQRDDWRDQVEENRVALRGLGLWGVPSFAVPGFSTWGQDRLFMLEARLPRRG